MVTERNKTLLGYKPWQVVNGDTKECFENNLHLCCQGQFPDDKNVDGS
jgi:hypothetical protein